MIYTSAKVLVTWAYSKTYLCLYYSFIHLVFNCSSINPTPPWRHNLKRTKTNCNMKRSKWLNVISARIKFSIYIKGTDKSVFDHIITVQIRYLFSPSCNFQEGSWQRTCTFQWVSECWLTPKWTFFQLYHGVN